MYSNPASRMAHKHANGWMTVLALGVLVFGLLACLYVLVGSPAEGQETGSTGSTLNQAGPENPAPTVQEPNTLPVPEVVTPAPRPPISYRPAQPAYQPAPPSYRRRQAIPIYLLPTTMAPDGTVQSPAAAAHAQADHTAVENELNAVRDQLKQSQDVLRQAEESQHKTRVASAVFLGIFAIIAALIVLQVYVQARGWDSETTRSGEEVEALHREVEGLRATGSEFRNALPALLQEVGEQPLSYQEEGSGFAPRALALIGDIDALAYVGHGRLAFRDLPSRSEAAVYLNGLLLSAVAHLSRLDPWTSFARLDEFFAQLAQFPDVVEALRIAQAYSYRALAAYQVLDSQDKEPTWLRKADRAQLEALSKQAFDDVAHAASIDPEWKHSTFVEALLCSRFYLTGDIAENGSRSELVVRGLRRSVTLYKSLIDERAYRGPSRRNLVRSLKQIAEQTGEKSDFSDFGYALNAFPTDEELADEALAARQPNSQDRFLWQWMLADEELFASVNRLNQAEYRAFWIRMLDNKVHLRNWRTDLAELQQANPKMKIWSIQLLQAEPPISLSNAISRRHERYDSSASGA